VGEWDNRLNDKKGAYALKEEITPLKDSNGDTVIFRKRKEVDDDDDEEEE
jgi:hypothetical protein